MTNSERMATLHMKSADKALLLLQILHTWWFDSRLTQIYDLTKKINSISFARVKRDLDRSGRQRSLFQEEWERESTCDYCGTINVWCVDVYFHSTTPRFNVTVCVCVDVNVVWNFPGYIFEANMWKRKFAKIVRGFWGKWCGKRYCANELFSLQWRRSLPQIWVRNIYRIQE